MKKIIVIAGLVLLGACWIFRDKLAAPAAEESPTANVSKNSPITTASGSAQRPPVGPPEAVNPSPQAPAMAASTPAPTEAATPPSKPNVSYPQMMLSQVLLPNNRFYDAVFGVSATYPEGWIVKEAKRWGKDNRENTVFFDPPAESRAVPSMYYQMYPDGPPAMENAEALLREQARAKEASRAGDGSNEYKNDPDSFVFREINGHPSLSYFATYTQGDQVKAEYFTRILGDKGYVMFFVRGPVEDIKAIIPAVYQMSSTVTPP
jgi:hypothetical protein